MSDNKIITAEFYLRKKFDIDPEKQTSEYLDDNDIEQTMVEFAKLKCQEQLEAIKKNVAIDLYVKYDLKKSRYRKIEENEVYDPINTIQKWQVNKNSINNAYNLDENIK